MADITARDLAAELNTTVPKVLQVADDEIDRVVAEKGLDKARGLSTHQGVSGALTLTAPLANLVRASMNRGR